MPARQGVEISFGERVRSMQRTPTGGAVSAIETSRRTLAVGPDDRVILAVPSWNLPDLLRTSRSRKAAA